MKTLGARRSRPPGPSGAGAPRPARTNSGRASGAQASSLVTRARPTGPRERVRRLWDRVFLGNLSSSSARVPNRRLSGTVLDRDCHPDPRLRRGRRAGAPDSVDGKGRRVPPLWGRSKVPLNTLATEDTVHDPFR